MTGPLDAEDAKLVTLARATRARLGRDEGAAVRDATGRTYTAASVELTALALSALEAAVTVAVASGADRLEAAAVVTGSAYPTPAVLAELGTARLIVAGPDGTVGEVRRLDS